MADSIGNSPSPFIGDVIELLAIIASRVNWKRLRLRNPVDMWNHRIRAACSCRDVAEFVSKLCNYFGLQSIPEKGIPLIEKLEAQREEVLDYILSRHIHVGTVSYAERRKQWQSESKDESDS